MSEVIDPVLSRYLDAYRSLIEVENVQQDSVTISFPFHYSGNHRIEVTVTKLDEDSYVISDMARTVGELRSFGYRPGNRLHEQIEKLSKLSGLRIDQDYLLLDSKSADLGHNIQNFLEATKTVADVYLVHRERAALQETDLLREVKHILNRRRVIYKEGDKISGKIEAHSVDLFVPPNGRPGMAIALLSGSNSHLTAEAWGFKSEDIKSANPRLKVGLVYDVVSSKWSDDSKRILESKADLAIPGNAMSRFEDQLVRQGVAAAD
ncbi:MAG: DUF1828 domain-containing protein [Terriglobia bacterium]